MPDVNLTVAARRMLVSAALAFSFSSLTAQAAPITIDGNLSDIIAKVGTSNTVNYGYGDDPLGSADSPTTESNNGFDIDKVYAWFNVATDTLYLGMSVYGQVGDSMPITDITSTNEAGDPFYDFICGTTWCNRNVFDSNETYGIQLYFGTSMSDPQLLNFAVLGGDDGSDSLLVGSNPYGLSINYAVSEFYNGVEFSIEGLLASGAVPYIANQDLLVRFMAGSGDLNATSSLLEDDHLLQMQVVPVPAAVWLFGSGLLGLVAVARRRRK